MRKIRLLFFVLPFLCSWSAGAQTPPEVVFSVTSGGEPLPYAYVFLKNAIYGSTDSLGRAVIPAAELTPGDTLMFSYVGSPPVRIAYDGKKAYSVKIDPVEIEAVSVTARRKVELGKDIIYVQNVNWNEEFRGDVQMGLRPGSASARSYSGQFLVVFIPSKDFQMTQIREFSPASGVDSLEPYFENMIHEAVVLSHLRPQSRMNRESHLSYDGLTKEGLAAYTLVRHFARNTANYQLRLYVDPASKIVRKITYYRVERTSLITQMDVDYVLSERGNRLYPSRIDRSVSDPGGKELFRARVSNTTLSGFLKKYDKQRRELWKAQKDAK